MHSLLIAVLTILCRFDSLCLASVRCKDTRVQKKSTFCVSHQQTIFQFSLSFSLFLLLFPMPLPLPMHMSISYVRIKCKWISENVLWHYLHAKCLELLCKFVGACVNCISEEGRKFFSISELKFQFSGQRVQHCACFWKTYLFMATPYSSLFLSLFCSHSLCYWTGV